MMSQQLLSKGSADHDEVEDAGEDDPRQGSTPEIFRMQQWLGDWFGSSAPMHGWRR